MEKEKKFFIVAIGFSGGGTDDLYQFFSSVPPFPNTAFIIIQHLGRDYVSRRDKMLARHTDMPVSWATDHELVKPGHIYMLPVNKFMTIKEGYLEIYDRDPLDKSNWAFDIFFHSMAENVKKMGIGIILSGAGTDGTKGAIHMHQENGMIMIRDPLTATFKGMPDSAILKDHPAEILSPKELAAALMSLVYQDGLDETEND
ncbi:chemotaxis protein CheB [Dyadobacter subterraneus]|uniref:protein-glutamate methylesterase n=1 Tax=Dyadobacter subterraneus TaxID=2773304 RepID=A0ABR9W878_9BACT|nr:chemotaxis protein CheB [Dyadobacter subterraneus]MBE9461682.1 chemotaxis protein CheB [Dyadobacter subterraneus]